MTTWIWVVLLLCIAMIAGGLFLRSYMSGGSSGTGLFGSAKAEKRLEVVEQAWVDNRRRLIIVRRDNVEHLIMTGGPVDLVIEDRIGAAVTSRGRPALAVDATPAVATFGGRTQRPAVGTSQAAGE